MVWRCGPTENSPLLYIGVLSAPPGDLPVPSFAEDNKREGKGVPFGRRLKSWKEIERRLGYPEQPAPGGTKQVN